MTPVETAADDVVLLDGQRRPIGTMDRVAVHGADTPLHLAFSLYLRNADGEVLFTRRAAAKGTWPGVWTNSCCGHPRPGEPVEDAVRRRLFEELGVGVSDLRCVLPDFSYVARDASGILENEVCPVFVGTILHPESSFAPNPDEVMDWAWASWVDLRTAVPATPFAFSPWAVEQVRQLPGHLGRGDRGTVATE